MRTEQEAKEAIEKYADMVRRICFVHLKNYHDVEDIFQDVFLKYIQFEHEFENEAHEKAWLIRVAINACKDMLKSYFRKNVVSFDELVKEPSFVEDNNRVVLETVAKLPQKYRSVIYLFYYEGYSAVEIAAIIKKSENTVYTWLSRARTQLKADLGGDFFEQQST
jgi:RNA polymerase sigma-70 factor (ECF subfamily)